MKPSLPYRCFQQTRARVIIIVCLGCIIFLISALVPHDTLTTMAKNNSVSARLKEIYKPLYLDKTWEGRKIQFPRSPDKHFNMDEDIKYFTKEIMTGGFSLTAMSEYPMEPHMSDWEWNLLEHPPLMDILDAGNETTSKLYIVGKRRTSFRVGDVLRVRVDIYNGRGEPLLHGGDDVRVWAVDLDNKASMATEVTDLRNGSYNAKFPLLWAGTVEIRARLAYNRHVIRAYHFILNVMKTTRLTMTGFESKYASEATLCSPFPWLPGFGPKICNFTGANGDHPWYCGHPKSPHLSCQHWNVSADLPPIRPLPFTPAEQMWFDWVTESTNASRIGQKEDEIVIHVKEKSKASDRGRNREKRSVADTENVERFDIRSTAMRNQASWKDRAPRGYFMNNEWVQRYYSLKEVSTESITKCFKNTKILLLGDSNLRLIYRVIGKRLGCVHQEQRRAGAWHKPLLCKHNASNIEMLWHVHSMPFHGGMNFKGLRGDSKPINDYLDEIPSTGKFVVFVHMFLHLAPHHHSVFTEHIRKMREAVERVLERNPSVKVALRGVHSVHKGWSKQDGNDMVAPWYKEIIRKEFAGLQDRVLYIQPWDMTVAAECQNVHPDNPVNVAIVRILLTHFCP